VSAVGSAGDSIRAATPWLRQVRTNAQATLATLVRPPRRELLWPSVAQLTLFVVGGTVLVLAVMVQIDGWSLAHVRKLPTGLVEAFNRFTDLGKGGVFLWPIGLVLIALALLDTPAMPRRARLMLAAWSVRLGFIFTAIAVPSLFATIIKRIIGRARPFVGGNDPFLYAPFGWRVDYASLPSGHATTAFAALVAIGSIFPQARALMWIYAVLIALSRVVVTAHHPSDVVAAAVVGVVGAWLVRQWFAARGLGFAVTANGAIEPMPGPGLPRIIKALARRLHAA
jgi:membrane-associated phospholipid phosphatase